ncbi:MAG: hypothetical protein GXP42_14520 [Chloroflexi bacterium]|nr:hypothetical protein [Chloroflexota bacterium]
MAQETNNDKFHFALFFTGRGFWFVLIPRLESKGANRAIFACSALNGAIHFQQRWLVASMLAIWLFDDGMV